LSNLAKGLILILVIVAIGAGLVVWKNKVGGQAGTESFNSISREEIEMLLADVAKSNPAILKKLAEDPEMKKSQIENLKQLLAFASQAQKEGLTADPTNRQELQNIKAEITAVNYDREINKDKGPMPPFGFITEDMVNQYWGQDGQPAADKGFLEKIGLGGEAAETRSHETEFNDFLNAKVALLKASSPEMKDREISEEEKTQAKDVFAKIRIYKAEYDTKVAAGELPKEFIAKVNLQVKLQQAQFLARIYSETIAEKMKVTDEEIAQYIAAHPELDPKEKRAKAQGILDRAKAGEDFAKLADEFSEDPGNKGPDGTGQGGAYKDVTKGKMVPAFEAGALAVQVGQVNPELIETDFGFHIIKLDRALSAGTAPKTPAAPGAPPASGETYDVRHILISSGVKDPEKPESREMPVKEFVRAKLEEEKEKKLLDDIIKANNVTVPTDFTVPEVSEQQMQEMKQKQQQQMMQQQGMPPGGPGGPDGPGAGAPPPPGDPKPAKPEPKTK